MLCTARLVAPFSASLQYFGLTDCVCPDSEAAQRGAIMSPKVIVCLLLLAVASRADESIPSTSADERLARLQAQIEASQKRLDQLQQVADQMTDAPLEAERTAAIKQQIREVLSEREFRESL